MKLFKKISPQVPLQLSNGRNLVFHNVDGEWGILRVGNDEILKEIAVCIKEERGGVFEITEAEYIELEQKKTMSPHIWRDEIRKADMAPRPPQTSQPPSLQNVAVSLEGPAQTPTPAPAAPEQAPPYRPTAIPRTPNP